MPWLLSIYYLLCAKKQQCKAASFHFRCKTQRLFLAPSLFLLLFLVLLFRGIALYPPFTPFPFSKQHASLLCLITYFLSLVALANLRDTALLCHPKPIIISQNNHFTMSSSTLQDAAPIVSNVFLALVSLGKSCKLMKEMILFSIFCSVHRTHLILHFGTSNRNGLRYNL